MEEKLNSILAEYKNKISQTGSLADLDKLFLELFGKNGVMTLLPKEFSLLEKEQLRTIGPLFNKVKIELENEIGDTRNEIREAFYTSLSQEKLDLTSIDEIAKLTARNDKRRKGISHPTLQFEQEIAELFGKLGFEQFSAPHIDSDYYNFEVLNIPKEHPARDLWDTLYIDQTNLDKNLGTLLLRTHTSNSQVRIMREFNLPIRMMVIDRCFRYENVDARHDHTFEQFEIVYIDKGVSMANLQYLSEYFLKAIFGTEIKVRLRPKYFPFVEPGAGVDGECIFCHGKGCKICGGVGWLELAGAGMIHPTVLKNGGIDPEKYTGIAWGFGPERIAMLKYGIEDLRTLKNGDLRELQKISNEEK